MSNALRLRGFLLLAPLLSLWLAFSLAARVAAAPVWVAPPAQQPGGNIAPPLNTSSQAQTKKGGLTIEGTVNIASGKTLTIGPCSGGACRICWNGTCKSGWTELTPTDYLTLNQTGIPTDTGYIDLNQTGVSPLVAATVTGSAGTPSLSASENIPTFGIQGVASTGTGYSTGVYGLATVGTSSFHYGIFADAGGFPLAWAGYFRGDVAVSDTYDLVIGGGSANANGGSPVAEICLGGVCRSSWPDMTGGSGYWDLAGSTLSPKEPVPPPRSIAFAGASSTAPFYVAVSGSGASSQADLKIRGSAQFDKFIVGSPLVSNPVSCGDGICSAPWENDTYCSTPGCRNAADLYCPQDCDLTPPANVEPVITSTSFRPCLPGECPVFSFRVGWINPSDPDFKATRLIIRGDRPINTDPLIGPVGPFDTVGAAVAQDFSILINVFSGVNCAEGTTYYAGLYAYDNMNNFAPGVLFNSTPYSTRDYLLCTDQDVVYEVE